MKKNNRSSLAFFCCGEQPILSKETVLPLSAMLAKKQRTVPNQKDCPVFQIFMSRFILTLNLNLRINIIHNRIKIFAIIFYLKLIK